MADIPKSEVEEMAQMLVDMINLADHVLGNVTTEDLRYSCNTVPKKLREFCKKHDLKVEKLREDNTYGSC